VVAHTEDQVVPFRRQLRLARSIPGATLHEIPAGHGAVAGGPERQVFLDALMRACEEVDGECRRRSPLGTAGIEARFAS
jgi:pimeloyl-ACP methyl ester carboxylesterase